MSYSVDVNILLYASDKSNSRNKKAVEFLKDKSSDSELFCVAWITLMSYLRISTHPSIFARPLSPRRALENIAALLKLSHIRTLTEVEGFFEIYSSVTGKFPVRGNLVPDAHLAAILKQHDVRTLFTNDTDFKKFIVIDL